MSTENSPSLDDMLRVLNAATERTTLRWASTAEEDTFRAEFGVGMVRIEKMDAPARYVLSLFDGNGVLLDEFQPSGEGQLLAIESLYKRVRSQALNLDTKLQGFYDRLKVLAGET